MTRSAHAVFLLALWLAATLSLAGCVTPNTAAPVAAQHVLVTNRVAESYAADLALQHALVANTAAALRTTLLGTVHRELIVAGYIVPPLYSVDAAKFDADLADASKSNALVREVRDGRLTRAQAVAWLNDYAAIQTVPSAADLRRAMLGRLGPLRQFDADTEAAFAALRARAASVADLLAAASADAEALRDFAEAKYLAQDAAQGLAGSLWHRLLVSRFQDPAKRAAVEAAGTRLFGDPAPAR